MTGLHGKLHGLDETVGGGASVGEVLSPAALAAGETDDYNPTNFSESVGTLRLTPDSAGSTLTGLVGGTAQREIRIKNLSASATLTFAHNSSASAAGNRFIGPNGQPVTLKPYGTINAWYDEAVTAWQVEQPGTQLNNQVIWQWNGVDTSQFAASPLLPTPTLGGGPLTGTVSLAVVSAAEGNRLRIRSVGVNQSGPAIYPVLASLGVSLPRRFIVRYSVLAGVAPSASVFGGFIYYTNGDVALASHFSIAFLKNILGATVWQNYCTGTAYNDSVGGTPASATPPCTIEVEVVGQKVVGVQPAAFVTHRSAGATAGSVGGSGYFLSDATKLTQPFPAGWNALTEADLDQFGVIMHSNSSETDPAVEFGMMQVLRHPLDFT